MKNVESKYTKILYSKNYKEFWGLWKMWVASFIF